MGAACYQEEGEECEGEALFVFYFHRFPSGANPGRAGGAGVRRMENYLTYPHVPSVGFGCKVLSESS